MRVVREQRNKYKARTEDEQHLPIRHAGRFPGVVELMGELGAHVGVS